ncbi:hypothetical protein [Staphylococcus equorum]|uniref:hypothetical protein n=1 Tax=Staphylococcus equorum TaxID=246432 RepID=UPI0007048372|nr:hypothetical protein [Staphylococcus equorum]ALM56954.1 hypothetical protein SE1039_11710 [Staphylococcus equorum]
MKNINEVNKSRDKDLVIDLRVANYNEVEFLVEKDQFVLSDENGNVYSKINDLNSLNLTENNKLKSDFIGIVKANNVRDFKLVFKINEETAKAKRLFLNISSKLNSNKTISFDLSNNKEEI